MISLFKSCFCPQGQRHSEINPRNAVTIIKDSLSNEELIESNANTLKSHNLSPKPEKKNSKISDVSEAVPQELIAHSYSSVASSITITPVIMQKKRQDKDIDTDANHKQSPIKRKHKILIEKIKEAEIKKYIYTPKQGNVGLIAIKHNERIEKIKNLNFEDATKEYNKLQEQGLILG